MARSLLLIGVTSLCISCLSQAQIDPIEGGIDRCSQRIVGSSDDLRGNLYYELGNADTIGPEDIVWGHGEQERYYRYCGAYQLHLGVPRSPHVGETIELSGVVMTAERRAFLAGNINVRLTYYGPDDQFLIRPGIFQVPFTRYGENSAGFMFIGRGSPEVTYRVCFTELNVFISTDDGQKVCTPLAPESWGGTIETRVNAFPNPGTSGVQ